MMFPPDALTRSKANLGGTELLFSYGYRFGYLVPSCWANPTAEQSCKYSRSLLAPDFLLFLTESSGGQQAVPPGIMRGFHGP